MTHDAIEAYLTKHNCLKFLESQSSSTNPRKKQRSEIKNSASELLVFVNSRRDTVSYSRQFEHLMNNSINRLKKNNIVIIYPEQ
jgi:hypothetical protein